MATSPPPPAHPIATPALHDRALRLSYRIGRGEQGVLTFEPYKSALLPHWRFATATAARTSASALSAHFTAYAAARDFVGMDMARKFLQMGATRAARYANYAGGRKYGADGRARDKGLPHRGRAEKKEASEVFRRALAAVKGRVEYAEERERFLAEQRAWDEERGGGGETTGKAPRAHGTEAAAPRTGVRRSARVHK